MPPSITNGWTEYQKLVMSTLEQHEKKLESMSETLTEIKVELGMLKVKSGVWGIVGGVIPMALTICALFFKKLVGMD